MTRRTIAAVPVAVLSLFASLAPIAEANPERPSRRQTIMIDGTLTGERTMSASAMGALAVLDRRLARDGLSVSTYEKIEIATTRNYIFVSATNLSKLEEEPFARRNLDRIFIPGRAAPGIVRDPAPAQPGRHEIRPGPRAFT